MKPSALNVEVARFLDAWFAVRQSIQAANFNRFQGAGLSATQFMTLNLLPVEGDGVAIGELARRMNLKPATVAKTVDSLEARRMVTRTRSDADKRIVFVKATDAGARLQNAASGHFQAHIEKLFRRMLPEQREGLILGLESFAGAAARERAADGPNPNGVPNAAPRAKRSSRRSLRE